MVYRSQMRATQKYRRNHYDLVMLLLPLGQRQKLKDYAHSTGRSMSGLIVQAIRELLEKERCASVRP